MADESKLRALMVSYQAGHFESFEEIYTLLAPVLRRYLCGQSRDATRAETPGDSRSR